MNFETWSGETGQRALAKTGMPTWRDALMSMRLVRHNTFWAIEQAIVEKRYEPVACLLSPVAEDLLNEAARVRQDAAGIVVVPHGQGRFEVVRASHQGCCSGMEGLGGDGQWRTSGGTWFPDYTTARIRADLALIAEEGK